MDFNQLINDRFSVRSFLSTKVDRQLILEVLESARMAPSAVNYQPWHFIVIDEERQLNEIRLAYPRSWFAEAPACIVICSDHSQSWKRKSDGKDFADIDAAIAIDHLILKATDLGLGTCWVCNFDAKIITEKLELPPHVEPVAIIPIGYTSAQPSKKTRKELPELVHWGKFTTR